MTICCVPVTFPYSSRVSHDTSMVNVSSSAFSFRSSGTRHEYPQVPPQPKGIGPSATHSPDEFVILTVGSSDS